MVRGHVISLCQLDIRRNSAYFSKVTVWRMFLVTFVEGRSWSRPVEQYNTENYSDNVT